MVNITRFIRKEDSFENFVRAFLVPPLNPERRAPAPAQFLMDVTENDKE